MGRCVGVWACRSGNVGHSLSLSVSPSLPLSPSVCIFAYLSTHAPIVVSSHCRQSLAPMLSAAASYAGGVARHGIGGTPCGATLRVLCVLRPGRVRSLEPSGHVRHIVHTMPLQTERLYGFFNSYSGRENHRNNNDHFYYVKTPRVFDHVIYVMLCYGMLWLYRPLPNVRFDANGARGRAAVIFYNEPAPAPAAACAPRPQSPPGHGAQCAPPRIPRRSPAVHDQPMAPNVRVLRGCLNSKEVSFNSKEISFNSKEISFKGPRPRAQRSGRDLHERPSPRPPERLPGQRSRALQTPLPERERERGREGGREREGERESQSGEQEQG